VTHITRLGRIRMECGRCRSVVMLPVERGDACPDRCVGCGAPFPAHSLAGLMKGLHEARVVLEGPDSTFLIRVSLEE